MHGVALGFCLLCLAALPSQILGNCIKGDCVNGFGLFRWKDGDSYEGEWRQGVQYQGVYTAADGGKYEGDWKDDQWTGYGVYTWLDGSVYAGQFYEDHFQGHGHKTWTASVDPLTYGGQFVESQYAGHGVEQDTKSRYAGKFWDGMKKGKGVLTGLTAEYFKLCEGEFNMDADGYAVVQLFDGRKYAGQLAGGLFDGYGHLEIPGSAPQIGRFEGGDLVETDAEKGGAAAATAEKTAEEARKEAALGEEAYKKSLEEAKLGRQSQQAKGEAVLHRGERPEINSESRMDNEFIKGHATNYDDHSSEAAVKMTKELVADDRVAIVSDDGEAVSLGDQLELPPVVQRETDNTAIGAPLDLPDIASKVTRSDDVPELVAWAKDNCKVKLIIRPGEQTIRTARDVAEMQKRTFPIAFGYLGKETMNTFLKCVCNKAGKDERGMDTELCKRPEKKKRPELPLSKLINQAQAPQL